MNSFTPKFTRNTGFTLIELLTVIAIIGILAAILIPAVGIAQDQVRKAQTKGFFNQIATAIEAYKNEYGYYPNFGGAADTTANDSVYVMSNATSTENLIMTLAGRDYDANELTADEAARFNPRRKQFMTFAQNNFASDPDSGLVSNVLGDAFGNTNFIIVMDKNKDGVIQAARLTTSVNLADGGTAEVPTNEDGTALSGNIYATVAIYSGGKSEDEEVIATWQ